MVRKNPDDVDVHMGFAFPDTYEIGMSYMGMQILYNILNKNSRIYCERVFAPASDMEMIMRRQHRSLYSLETFTPVGALDILGFTLQYEMSYTNILNMLDLGLIPVRKADRASADGRYPLVVAGGPCAFNPEPLADFVDVFLIGDGEELLEKVCIAFADAKEACGNNGHVRDMFYDTIKKFDGVYIPDSGQTVVNRAVVSDIDKAVFPVDNIVPFIDTVHDRSVIETFRGCTRGCRFCQAGMIYRPVRERKPETIKKLAVEQLAATGHDELSLLSLSTSDYSQFETMATDLMGICRQNNVALSLPSLRLDSFSFKVLQEIQGYRKSGLTFAPEAGTQRLRDVINKNISEEDIYDAVRQAIILGWEHIKLYFMIGLPTETYEDLDGIAEIAKAIMDINYDIRGRKGGRFRVTVSVSNFVPKPHTPFQWSAQDTPEEFIKKHNYLSERLHIKGVTFNYHETATSNLEAVFARGDRRCGRILEEAWKRGCKFDAWTEHFRPDLWRDAMDAVASEYGLKDGKELEAYYNYRERPIDENLPWDRINSFIDKKYLIDEKKRAEAAETTPDCRLKCNNCGINRHTECFVNCDFNI